MRSTRKKNPFLLKRGLEVNGNTEKKRLNYYPFGMLMPNRHGSDMPAGEDYDYGFGGMMKDNEVNGNNNSYTTQFRQYDPRIGRWLSIDPLFANFPWQSPYVGFDNNPIYFKDPLGAAAEGPDDPPVCSTCPIATEKNPIETGTTKWDIDGTEEQFYYNGETWKPTVTQLSEFTVEEKTDLTKYKDKYGEDNFFYERQTHAAVHLLSFRFAFAAVKDFAKWYDERQNLKNMSSVSTDEKVTNNDIGNNVLDWGNTNPVISTNDDGPRFRKPPPESTKSVLSKPYPYTDAPWNNGGVIETTIHHNKDSTTLIKVIDGDTVTILHHSRKTNKYNY